VDSHEEPLARWAERRERRLRPVGERKTVTLAPGPQRAAHLCPEVPRLVAEWDGYQWITMAVVEDYAAAQRLMHGTTEATVPVNSVSSPDYRPSAAGTGRHRKP
jgi:hypothetical protein